MATLSRNRCRLCSNISRKLKTVEKSLTKQIVVLYQISIEENMETRWPKSICPSCLSTVNTSWKFYNKVQKAQKKLEGFIEDEEKSEKLKKRVKATKSKKVEESDLECDDSLESYPAMESDGTDDESLKREDCSDVVKVCLSDPVDDVCVAVSKSPVAKVKEKPMDPIEEKSPKNSWPDYPWICNICGDKCSDVIDYKSHPCFAFHERFFCADCPKALSKQTQFFAHVTEHHWDRHQKHLLLECDICHSWFNSKEEQEVHRGLEHAEVGPRPSAELSRPLKNALQCEVCGTQCKTKGYYNHHMKKHTGEKPFVCDICGKAFVYKTKLTVHRKIHSAIKEFVCDECGSGFTNKGQLVAHMAIHSDARPFSCDICPKSFKTGSTLADHKRMHTGEKPYICSICGLGFGRPTNLRIHTRIHSDKKNYQCDICEKTFKFKNNMDVHKRQHTGEQPYACVVCARRFTGFPNCSKHMKRIHGMTVKPSQCKLRSNKGGGGGGGVDIAHVQAQPQDIM